MHFETVSWTTTQVRSSTRPSRQGERKRTKGESGPTLMARRISADAPTGVLETAAVTRWAAAAAVLVLP